MCEVLLNPKTSVSLCETGATQSYRSHHAGHMMPNTLLAVYYMSELHTPCPGASISVIMPSVIMHS